MTQGFPQYHFRLVGLVGCILPHSLFFLYFLSIIGATIIHKRVGSARTWKTVGSGLLNIVKSLGKESLLSRTSPPNTSTLQLGLEKYRSLPYEFPHPNSYLFIMIVNSTQVDNISWDRILIQTTSQLRLSLDMYTTIICYRFFPLWRPLERF